MWLLIIVRQAEGGIGNHLPNTTLGLNVSELYTGGRAQSTYSYLALIFCSLA